MNEKQKKALETYNYYISMKSHDIKLSNIKKIQLLEGKYKSLKGLTRDDYSQQFSKMLLQVRKNIDVLDDIKKQSTGVLKLLNDLELTNEAKDVSNLLMSVKEDFDTMVEVNSFLSKF